MHAVCPTAAGGAYPHLPPAAAAAAPALVCSPLVCICSLKLQQAARSSAPRWAPQQQSRRRRQQLAAAPRLSVVAVAAPAGDVSVQEEKLDGAGMRLHVSVPAEQCQKAYNTLMKELREGTTVQGFRKGKVRWGPPSGCRLFCVVDRCITAVRGLGLQAPCEISTLSCKCSCMCDQPHSLPPPGRHAPAASCQAPDAALIAHVGGAQRVYNSVLSEMLEPLVAQVGSRLWVAQLCDVPWPFKQCAAGDAGGPGGSCATRGGALTACLAGLQELRRNRLQRC